MSNQKHSSVVILGAGLTGLSAARHLKGHDYVVYEKLGHVGGHAITNEERGYRFDRTGHLLHLRDPEIKAWIDTLFAPGHLRAIQRRSMVFSHGVYTRYPYQANTFGLPPEIAFECLKGYLDAKSKKWPTEPENFEEFCLQHFGEGFSKHFMIPYNSRLWGVHPREITAAWCQRFVPMPKLDDVLAGAVGMNSRELGYNASFLYPPTGIQELPDAIAPQIPGIHLNRAPSKIDWKKKQITFDDGVSHSYDALITTAPLKALCALLFDAPQEVLDAAAKLRCNRLWYLDVATTKPELQNLHWSYVPEEKYPFYRIGCYSNFSELLAPPGGASFYVELADREEPDMSVVGPQVAKAMVEMRLIQSESDVLFMSPRKIEYAYVVFDHHYFGAVETVKRFLQANAIISHGRYGAWNYSSMEDALIYGREAAQTARELSK